MQQPEIVVSPESNGVMELTCKVPFIGGCCFTLTSHDVTASLDVPKGLALLNGPVPLNYPAVVAPPSGTPLVWATFLWHLERTNSDSENEITVTVSSPDSGQVKATHTLGQQVRSSVTGPRLPEVLPLGQSIPISVEAACLDQDRFLKNVRFWYSTEIPSEAEKVDVSPDLAAKGIFRFSMSGKQLMVQGKSVVLARKYEPTTWRGMLPAQKLGSLYGVAIATDDAGKTAFGPVVHVAAPANETKSGNMRWWIVVGAFFATVLAVVMIRRRGVLAVAGIAVLLAVAAGIAWIVKTPVVTEAAAVGYPTNSSTVVYMFLDQTESSRMLAEQMETYRRAVPHRLHMLCFVEGVTPDSVMRTYRDRYHVGRTPTVVFDGHVSVEGTNGLAAACAMDRCFEKPASRLSMELRGGVIAGNELSLGFIMCNHASRKDARGSATAFAVENGVQLNGWQWEHVVRHVMMESRQYSIPTGKCQPPAIFKWEIPAGVIPSRISGLTVILDEEGHLIDSICTEGICSRTGVCG
jgi:hypothetical protein